MIKIAILAAVTAVGLGAAAEAATVTSESYNLLLRYEGTDYQMLEFVDLQTGQYLDAVDVPAALAPAWLKPQKFTDLKFGETVKFSFKINYMSPPEYDSDFGNGGSAPICQIGPVSCTNTNFTRKGGDGVIELAYSDRVSILTNAQIDGYLVYSNWTLLDTYFTEDGRYWYGSRFEEAKFTIVQPAPVPLPASAALLPLGFGALAMMRKRRKRVS